MEISLSRRHRDSTNRFIAVWSPVAAGKTTAAVNIAALISARNPVSLVDFSPDYGVCTYLNCSGAAGLYDLLEGDSEGYYSITNYPNLKIYTAKPGSKTLYNGEASKINAITKALKKDEIVIFDTPRDYLKAANIIALSDKNVLVADYNIHGSTLLQAYSLQMNNKIMIVNRYSDHYPSIAEPSAIVGITPSAIIPDLPAESYQSIIAGVPLVDHSVEARTAFEEIEKEVFDLA